MITDGRFPVIRFYDNEDFEMQNIEVTAYFCLLPPPILVLMLLVHCMQEMDNNQHVFVDTSGQVSVQHHSFGLYM